MAEFDLETMARALAVNKADYAPQLDRIRQFIKDNDATLKKKE